MEINLSKQLIASNGKASAYICDYFIEQQTIMPYLTVFHQCELKQHQLQWIVTSESDIQKQGPANVQRVEDGIDKQWLRAGGFSGINLIY